MSSITKDDPGADVDKEDGHKGDNAVDVEEKEQETNESASEDRNKSAYIKMMVTV
jgi:hypothetical protein